MAVATLQQEVIKIVRRAAHQYSLLCREMFFYRSYQCVKVSKAVDLFFRQQNLQILFLFKDNRIFEVLVIFFAEFVPVQELYGNPYGDAERFPSLDFGEWSMGQFAEAAIVGIRAQNFVSQVDETADRVAVGVVDEDEFHPYGF